MVWPLIAPLLSRSQAPATAPGEEHHTKLSIEPVPLESCQAVPPPPAMSEPATPRSGSCSGRPRLLAVGVAPLGIISIGIVPMGVVSIGVVPMGVVCLGAVAMGVVNAAVVSMGVVVAGVNVMGVWWSGMEGMGPYRLNAPAALSHHHRDPLPAAQAHPEAARLHASREAALGQARQLGCEGAHRMGDRWMPCAHHPAP